MNHYYTQNVHDHIYDIHTFPPHKATDHDDKEKWQYNNYHNDYSYCYVDITVTYTYTIHTTII